MKNVTELDNHCLSSVTFFLSGSQIGLTEDTKIVYDVVEKTSTRRRSRIPCVVVEKIMTCRREDSSIVVGEEYKKLTNFQ